MKIFIVPIYTHEANENKDILTVSENNQGDKLFSSETSQARCLFLDNFFNRIWNHSYSK